jgi:stearoyl-CoA desaturase (Delta-9 desaturase)
MSTDVLERKDDSTQNEAAEATSRELSPPRPAFYRLLLTGIIVLGPLVVAVVVMAGAFGNPVPWFAIALMVVFLAVVSHGTTIGFHRLFTHRSFEARRPLKISLAVLGSMAFEGSLIGWVANHRRHHRFADRAGDPHSPLWVGAEPARGWRGFWHAHVGWTFRGETTPREHYASDLLADPDLVFIDRLFAPLCVATLALPAAIGFAVTGTLAGALGALLFAGVIRVGISHNATWSINSVCHKFGKRSFQTKDASTNVGALALLTMGESWHNNHHAFPRLARHGFDRGQLDTSAALIRLFERFGWASNVQWPNRVQLELRRVPARSRKDQRTS